VEGRRGAASFLLSSKKEVVFTKTPTGSLRIDPPGAGWSFLGRQSGSVDRFDSNSTRFKGLDDFFRWWRRFLS